MHSVCFTLFKINLYFFVREAKNDKGCSDPNYFKLSRLSRTGWSRGIISNERDLGPRINQNPKFTPLRETTSIPATFIWESPSGVTCLHLSTINVISVKGLVVVMLPTMKQQRLQSRLTPQLRCGGLFMLKASVCFACCAKNMTCPILKISRKFLTRRPESDFAQKSLKITAVRHII